MRNALTQNFIVTTSIGGASRKQIWKAGAPLKIGYPMQWMMESTDQGVRVTYLGGRANEASRTRVQEISYSQLQQNPQITLGSEQGKSVDLRIEPAVRNIPAYDQNSKTDSEAGARTLSIYRTLGEWVLEAERSEAGEYSGRIGSKAIFKIKRASAAIHIIPLISQLTLLKGGETVELKNGAAVQLSAADLVNSVISFGPNGWRFGWVTQNPVASRVQKLPAIDLSADSSSQVFVKALRGAAIALGALITLSLLWPKPKTEELIPAQFAKIVLTTPKHQAAAAAAEAAAAPQSSAQKKVQETAVVQAFRAKALQSAVSNLMKGGMTRLLAQSDFVAGHRKDAEASKIFAAQSKDLRATAPMIGELGSKSISVASLGGNGLPGAAGSGKAVGYGKGEHASVTGQGKGFVSMDMANSSVEEGLTKDEVGEVIHRHLSEVRYCYESAMIRTPDIEGKLVVDFVIGGSGVVKTAEAKSSTLPDPRLDDCIIRRLATWKFPNTKGGIDVAVTYPFIFKTLGR
jgi:hypothetical protein